ncbi:MAG: glycosyltransferase family 4 protein [Planctomycetes bacterium]|nr:glycosyltransferase family 4 protein [Planctomycetota bacterium]
MNLALLTSVAGNGGSASTAFHLTRLLCRAGHRAVLFAPGEYWPERGRAEGVPVQPGLELRRGFHAASFFRDYRTLKQYVNENAVDAILVQKSPEQWLAAAVRARAHKRPALIRLRGVVFEIKPTATNRWLHNSMPLVVCSASAIARQFQVLPEFRTDTVKVLLEGIDTQRFKPASAEEKRAARQHFGLQPTALYFGTAGRPSPVKGHDLLVRAFGRLCTEHSKMVERFDVRLAIFSDESRRGPGSYADLRDLSLACGAPDRVDLCPGFVEDMRDVYRALDSYVLPSRGSEGSSRAGLEASASGLPLIASSVGVLPDLVRDGETGLLVPPNDEAALAHALKRILDDESFAQRLGTNARRRMENELREDLYVARLAELLTAACTSKPKA